VEAADASESASASAPAPTDDDVDDAKVPVTRTFVPWAPPVSLDTPVQGSPALYQKERRGASLVLVRGVLALVTAWQAGGPASVDSKVAAILAGDHHCNISSLGRILEAQVWQLERLPPDERARGRRYRYSGIIYGLRQTCGGRALAHATSQEKSGTAVGYAYRRLFELVSGDPGFFMSRRSCSSRPSTRRGGRIWSPGGSTT
jgi:hypothetical protein